MIVKSETKMIGKIVGYDVSFLPRRDIEYKGGTNIQWSKLRAVVKVQVDRKKHMVPSLICEEEFKHADPNVLPSDDAQKEVFNRLVTKYPLDQEKEICKKVFEAERGKPEKIIFEFPEERR